MKLKSYHCHDDGKTVRVTESNQKEGHETLILAPNKTIAKQVYDANLRIRRLQTE